ncbi:MAG: GBS Bsp-like repeat-containing protein, partial [Christensenella sp.]|uniref:GBS Bsp-like repeat-containing protein n=1 Tax=Christensenella sp. TaxID=1935934 RepID=UPI002B209E36
MKKIKKLVLMILSVVIALSVWTFVPSETQVAKAAEARDGFVVFINPGHGPSSKGVAEALYNEQVAVRLYHALVSKGMTVYMTNPISIAPELPSIITAPPNPNNSYGGKQYEFLTELLPAINTPWVFQPSITKRPDLVVSVHHNDFKDKTVNGYETYYSSMITADYGKDATSVARSKDLAFFIDNEFKKPGYVYQPRKPSVKDDEVNSITSRSIVPSVLVEVAFMSNANDLKNIKNGTVQEETANRIANGVSSYRAKYGDNTPPIAKGVNATPYGDDGKFFHAGALQVTDASGIAKVEFAVWNEKTGDVKWYQGNAYGGGDYGALINIANHGNQTGRYYVQSYATDRLGNQGLLGTASYMIDSTPPAAKGVNVTPYGEGGKLFHAGALKVTAPMGIKEVTFAVWSDKTGEVKWYKGNAYGGGDYGALIHISNHGNQTGRYNVWTYATDYLNNQILVGQLTYDVVVDTTPPTSTGSNATDIGEGPNGLEFHAGALNVTDPSGVAEVTFAVWSEKTGDVKWYKGSAYGGGNYGAIVNISNHNYNGG